MLEGVIAHHHEPPIPYQKPLLAVSCIPPFLQSDSIVPRIICTVGSLYVFLQLLVRAFTRFASSHVPVLSFRILYNSISGPCERSMPL